METAPPASIGSTGHANPAHEADRRIGPGQSFLALTALGVVFGDIGTSPLYTFSTALNATGHAPGTTEVLGIVSLTFWALMLLISVKYVTFVLRADNDGEVAYWRCCRWSSVRTKRPRASNCRSWSCSA
jgi:hypothetical protein